MNQTTTWNEVHCWSHYSYGYSLKFDRQHPSTLDELNSFSKDYNQPSPYHNKTFNLYYGLNVERMEKANSTQTPAVLELLDLLFDQGDSRAVVEWSYRLLDGVRINDERGLVLYTKSNLPALMTLLTVFSNLVAPYNCKVDEYEGRYNCWEYCILLTNTLDNISFRFENVLHRVYQGFIYPGISTMFATNNSDLAMFYRHKDEYHMFQARDVEIDAGLLTRVKTESPTVLYTYLKEYINHPWYFREYTSENFLQADKYVRFVYMWIDKLVDKCFTPRLLTDLYEEFCRIHYLISCLEETTPFQVYMKTLFNSDTLCFPNETTYKNNLKQFNNEWYKLST